MAVHVYPFTKCSVSYILPFWASYFLNIDILFIARNSIMCAEKHRLICVLFIGIFTLIRPLFFLVQCKSFHLIALPNILFLSIPSLTLLPERVYKAYIGILVLFLSKKPQHLNDSKSHFDIPS